MSCMTLLRSVANSLRVRPVVERYGQRSLLRDRRGAAAIEFGLLLPFLVVLLAGISDMGRSIWQHHTLQKGARDAAEYLAKLDAPFTAAQRAAAKDLLVRGEMDSGAPLRFGHWSSSVTTNLDTETGLVTPVDNSAGTFRGPDTINVITVTASVAAPGGEFPFLSLFGGGNVQYSARHQTRNIGE